MTVKPKLNHFAQYMYAPMLTLYSIGYFFRSWRHFLFLDTIEKIQEKLKLSFEYFWNIMENGAFDPFLHNIFKYMIFQRRRKALLWSKGLYNTRAYSFTNSGFTFFHLS